MPIDFTNINLVWTSILVETLSRLGLKTAVICPGSRSAPLAIAFAHHPHLEAIPVLDERSAAFFALGMARRHHRPVVLVCTSGTAGANFLPAVIEARVSRVPLLVLTADRPPELRDCNAGQAIDQQKLYGSFPNWYTELALPTLDATRLAYLRQTMIHAWQRSQFPVAGPVHLNCPFREPLAPLPDAQAQAQALTFRSDDFFAAVQPPPPTQPAIAPTALPLAKWQSTPAGIIIAGPAQPADPAAYGQAIAHLSRCLGYPVLAEGLSPLRNWLALFPNLITTYDLLLRNPTLAEKLVPQVVIRIGEMPTSKQLRTWLATNQPRQWILDPAGVNLDPLHGHTVHLPVTVETVAASLPATTAPPHPYEQLWHTADQQTRATIHHTMTGCDRLLESKVAWVLSQHLPPDTPIFICNSTPIRDVEFFWMPGNTHIQPYCNRGANGIDGSLSTALGMAHHQAPAVMLAGDLALLHDTNGFLLRHHFSGHLTIVLINNDGGGIFEMLPIARFDPPFENFFATPQTIDFAHLCRTYGVQHDLISDWETLIARLNPLPQSGIRILEIQSDRKADAQWRQNNLGTFAANIDFALPLYGH